MTLLEERVSFMHKCFHLRLPFKLSHLGFLEHNSSKTSTNPQSFVLHNYSTSLGGKNKILIRSTTQYTLFLPDHAVLADLAFACVFPAQEQLSGSLYSKPAERVQDINLNRSKTSQLECSILSFFCALLEYAAFTKQMLLCK